MHLIRLFTYGTLMRGMPRAKLISDQKFIGQDKIGPGYTLHDLGQFPTIRKGLDDGGLVYGEVYDVDKEALSHLDIIEGYRSDQQENSLYMRVEVNTSKFGPAMSYMLSDTIWRNLSPLQRKIIDSGDWTKR